MDEPPPEDAPPPPDDAPVRARPAPPPPPRPAVSASMDRDISLDDPEIEGSGMVGRPVVEQLLGGKVIEERDE